MKSGTQRGRGSAARQPSAPFTAVITVDVGGGRRSAAEAQAFVKAIAPEAARGLPGSRVRLNHQKGGKTVDLVIEAENLPTLRAAVNSYMRLAALAADVAGVVESKRGSA